MGRRASPWPAILTGPAQLRKLRPFSNRFGNELCCHVVDTDPEDTEADLHADLACVAALWDLSVQGLSAEELDVNDLCFPLVAGAHADKPA